MSARSRRVVAEELLTMTALLLSYIWVWQGSFPGDFLVCVGLYFGLGALSHLRRGETAAEIGLRVDNLGRSLWDAAKLVGPLLLIPLLLGAARRSLQYPGLTGSLSAFVQGWAWGTAQQYGLVCFYYRGLVELLRDERQAALGAALLFTLFHLPNPFLMLVTFLGGILSCWLYRRGPNLAVLGAMHAVLSFVMLHSLGREFTFRMRVGPGFWT